jgi:hypothetical protein
MTNSDRLARYTTEALEGGSVHPRQARALLRLDTPERRCRAYDEACTRQNLHGGILSAQIWEAASDLLRMVEDGVEDREMYAEGVARRHREAESEMRRLTGEPVILFPREMGRVNLY